MSDENGPSPTVENRTYLFREMAVALIKERAKLSVSSDPVARARFVQGLADLARVACVVADSDGKDADEVYRLVLADHGEVLASARAETLAALELDEAGDEADD